MSEQVERSAERAGLRYVDDFAQAIRRERRGDGFDYRYADGRSVRDRRVLERIRGLVVPPAWEHVRICPDPRGHIQAVGRDARGRKQYLYHPLWNEVRSRSKFDALRGFILALPAIRKRVRRDLSRKGMPREKVLALLAALLEQTLLRVGSDIYTRRNASYGLTTLEDVHLDRSCPGLCLTFSGKGGKHISISVDDSRLVRLLEHIQELPGQRLFQYVTETGRIEHLDSGDLNAYLKQACHKPVTAKEYRTWGGSILMLAALERAGRPGTGRERNTVVRTAVKQVARSLNNTPAVCRKYYIHPRIIQAYEQDVLTDVLARGARRARRNKRELSRHEEALLVLLQSVSPP